jgi:hypothetical protein
MIKTLSIPFFLLLCFSRIGFSQETGNSEKLRTLVLKNGQAEVSIPIAGRKETDKLARNVSIRSVRKNKIYIILSPLTVEWFISGGYNYSIIERAESKGIRSSLNVKQAMQWESYPSYTQYDSIMRSFASDYPSFCRLDTIGTSIRGKLVMALKISDNCHTEEPEPKVFYTSSMHGDETGGYVLMLRFAEYLLKNYSTDSRIRNLVDNLEIWINPLANPDGTYNGSNYINSPTRNNANGYDLNRNFPDPEVTYVPRQKETIDMMKFLAKHRFTLSANFHSGEEVVNYPWDRWEWLHADNDWYRAISRKYADTVHMHSPKGYMDFLDNGITNGYDWYPVYGGRQDYVNYSLYGREVTIELDTNYVAPADYLPELWEYNRQSLIGYLENALYGIHGQILDSYNEKPVPVKIFIEKHDKDNSHVYSDTVSGEFVRLLKPGFWDLRFSADRYRDTTIMNVSVADGEETRLEVKMEPYLNPEDTADRAVPLIYPDPASTFIKAVVPKSVRGGTVNVRIINLAGMKVSDFDTDVSDRDPVFIDISRFASGTYVIIFTSKSKNLSSRARFVIFRRY